MHIEGPHLNPAKKGIHDKARFAAIDAEVIARLAQPTLGGASSRWRPNSPRREPCGADRCGRAGLRGHSLADYDQTRAALAEGLAGFTHLFNAMTQFLSREPGMVGAALEDRASHFGLIVDGLHVHPAACAWRCGARQRRGDAGDRRHAPGGRHAGPVHADGQDIAVVDGTCRGRTARWPDRR
jgi:N-acetylglucosamine-6-phosphate deacetylase